MKQSFVAVYEPECNWFSRNFMRAFFFNQQFIFLILQYVNSILRNQQIVVTHL